MEYVSILHISKPSGDKGGRGKGVNLLYENTLKHDEDADGNNHHAYRRHNPMDLRTIEPGPGKDEQANRN